MREDMSKPFKATKKPVTVEAILYTGDNILEIYDFTCDCAACHADVGMAISTLEGDMIANIGDYIIKGVNGEFYPCKPDIFEKTYDF